ncbi:MAG: hypothetical protein MZV63_58415 [Marinilabiliales bacterium]|nr:hypothetical protein [Marinilabiliales bacterium]
MLVAGASSYPRLIDYDGPARHRGRGLRLSAGRHGPHRGPGGGPGHPEPRAARALRDLHHLQDPDGAPRRGDPVRARFRQEDRPLHLPRHPGHPDALARGRQGGLFPPGRHARVPCGPGAHAANRRPPRRRSSSAQGYRPVSGGHRQPHGARRPAGQGPARATRPRPRWKRPGSSPTATSSPSTRRSTQKTSGLRLGTPGICTRGMGEDEVRLIAGWIDRILSDPADAGRSTARARRGAGALPPLSPARECWKLIDAVYLYLFGG